MAGVSPGLENLPGSPAVGAEHTAVFGNWVESVSVSAHLGSPGASVGGVDWGCLLAECLSSWGEGEQGVEGCPAWCSCLGSWPAPALFLGASGSLWWLW